MRIEVKIGLAVLCSIIALLPLLVVFYVKNKKTRQLSRQKQDPEKIEGIPAVSQTHIGTPAAYHKISPKEAKEWMDSGKDAVLIDVRSKEEYEQERIAGSILMPDYEIEAQAPAKIPDKDTRIIVYCLSGVRSQRVAKQLVSLHYTNVYDMGGMLSWPFETIHG